MVNAALVGLGRWGTRLVEAVAGRTDRLRITHAVNRTPGKNAELARRHGIEMLPSLEAALRHPAVEAILLATPHSQHADHVVATARAGKPIFVEKPFTLTLAEADRALAAVREAGIVLAAGHNRRFIPAIADLKREVAAGTLGRILHIESNISGDVRPMYKPEMWRTDRRESPAGGMAGAGIHMIDAMIHLAGPMARIAARSRRLALDVAIDDTTAVLIDFASGATGTLATLMATVETCHIRVFGTGGAAEWRGDDGLELRLIGKPPERRSYAPSSGVREELEAFADAVAGRAPYPIPLSEIRAGIAAFETVTRAADGNQVLAVPQDRI